MNEETKEALIAAIEKIELWLMSHRSFEVYENGANRVVVRGEKVFSKIQDGLEIADGLPAALIKFAESIKGP